jgi:hypothetical protein
MRHARIASGRRDSGPSMPVIALLGGVRLNLRLEPGGCTDLLMTFAPVGRRLLATALLYSTMRLILVG